MEQVSVQAFFNETRGSRFNRYEAGAKLVKSELSFSGPVSGDHEDLLNRVYRDMNAPDRANGPRERSLSMADVIVIQTPDGNVPYEVSMVGFRQMAPGEIDWQAQLDPRSYLEVDGDD